MPRPPSSTIVAGRKALPTTTLGTRRATPFTYSPELLEAIPIEPRANGDQPMWVTKNCLRFSSLCPVTGQPDWAELCLNFVPAKHLVESKSLKEYLNSFRNHGDFHEDCIRIICNDLAALLRPRYLEVMGHFDSRGSIAIWPYVQHADARDAWAKRLRDQRFAAYRPGGYGPQGYGRFV
jgi:7-cyano-7-deazaguanine reductase